MSRKIYYSTPEMDEYLRQNYRRTRPSLLACHTHLNEIRPECSAELPVFWVKQRCQLLGLCRTKEERWTPEQISALKNGIREGINFNLLSRRTGRTITAYVLKAKRLDVRRIEARNYLTARDIEKALGVECHRVVEFIASGRLPAKLFYPDLPSAVRGNKWIVLYSDLRSFVLNNPAEIFLPKVEKIFLFKLLSGQFDNLRPSAGEADPPGGRYMHDLYRACYPGPRRVV
jgi:hypothetical protein